MADEESKGETPEVQSAATSETVQEEIPWRNEKEIRRAVEFSRVGQKRLEELERKLAEALEPKPEKKAAKPADASEEALREVRQLRMERDFRDALDEHALDPKAKRIAKDMFAAVKPENPGEWLKQKITEYGWSTPDENPARASGTLPGHSGAPGRETSGVASDPKVFARQNPRAWASMTADQRAQKLADWKRSQGSAPLFGPPPHMLERGKQGS